MEVVNGYPCKDCTDVEYAKKGVDPARPDDGPQGAYATEKPEEPKAERGPAVSFGGAVQGPPPTSEVEAVREPPYVPGASVDFRT